MAIGLVKSFHSENMNWKSRFREMVFQVMTVKYLVYISATLVMVYARLSAMNFTSPEFKEMDNPVAASDEFLTKVSVSYFRIKQILHLISIVNTVSEPIVLVRPQHVDSFVSRLVKL